MVGPPFRVRQFLVVVQAQVVVFLAERGGRTPAVVSFAPGGSGRLVVELNIVGIRLAIEVVVHIVGTIVDRLVVAPADFLPLAGAGPVAPLAPTATPPPTPTAAAFVSFVRGRFTTAVGRGLLVQRTLVQIIVVGFRAIFLVARSSPARGARRGGLAEFQGLGQAVLTLGPFFVVEFRVDRAALALPLGEFIRGASVPTRGFASALGGRTLASAVAVASSPTAAAPAAGSAPFAFFLSGRGARRVSVGRARLGQVVPTEISRTVALGGRLARTRRLRRSWRFVAPAWRRRRSLGRSGFAGPSVLRRSVGRRGGGRLAPGAGPRRTTRRRCLVPEARGFAGTACGGGRRRRGLARARRSFGLGGGPQVVGQEIPIRGRSRALGPDRFARRPRRGGLAGRAGRRLRCRFRSGSGSQDVGQGIPIAGRDGIAHGSVGLPRKVFVGAAGANRGPNPFPASVQGLRLGSSAGRQARPRSWPSGPHYTGPVKCGKAVP